MNIKTGGYISHGTLKQTKTKPAVLLVSAAVSVICRLKGLQMLMRTIAVVKKRLAEVFLLILKGKSLEEGIWLMNLVSAATHYPDSLFKKWLEGRESHTNTDVAADNSNV